jgi:hypothetical protein
MDRLDYESEDETQSKNDNNILNQKIIRWLELQKEGKFFNDKLMTSKSFRNPSIIEKVIEYLGVDQYGSNLDEERDFDVYERYTRREAKPQPMHEVVNVSNPVLANALRKAEQRGIEFRQAGSL